MLAPALTPRGAVWASTPPSISRSQFKPRLLDHLADLLNFGQRAFDEFLAAEAGVDGHHEDQIEIGDDFGQHAGRRGRIDRDAGFQAEAADFVDGAVQVGVVFPVNDQRR